MCKLREQLGGTLADPTNNEYPTSLSRNLIEMSHSLSDFEAYRTRVFANRVFAREQLGKRASFVERKSPRVTTATKGPETDWLEKMNHRPLALVVEC